MKRVAQNRERNMPITEGFKELPEVWVQNRVSSGDVEVRNASECLTEIYAVPEYSLNVRI